MAVVLSAVSQAYAYLGGVGTGKTQALVDRVRTLVAQGAAASEVVLFCAAPQAAQEVRHRLAQVAGCSDVRVLTPRAFALQVLSSPQAQAFTGRRARMLLPFEEAFLFEDVRTSGIKERRSREMQRFFARSWTELADFDEGWLLEGEETVIHSLIKSCLALSGGMLEPEIANFAVRYLRAHREALDEARVRHVLADDYGLLSRASQVLVNLVAGESLALAADPFATDRVFESYPYAAGVGEFLEANPHAEVVPLTVCWRSQATAQVAQRLLTEERGGVVPARLGATGAVSYPEACGAAPRGVLEEQVCARASDEPGAVAALVAQALEEGMAPRDVCVVYANRAWGRRLARALEERGLTPVTLAKNAVGAGDVRKPHGCVDARLLTLLALAANPHDALAWRSMCGFGEALAESYAFKMLRARAEATGQGVAQLLSALAGDDPTLPAELRHASRRVVEVYRSVCRQLERLHGLTGPRLLSALCVAVTGEERPAAAQAFLALFNTVPDDATARELHARALHQLTLGGFVEDADAPGVRVVDARDTCGLNPRLLVFAGFVNGFIPSHRFFDKEETVEKEAQKLLREGLRTLYAALGRAREAITVSRFTRMPPAEAQGLGVKVDRIRLEEGARVCVVGASVYLKLIK